MRSSTSVRGCFPCCEERCRWLAGSPGPAPGGWTRAERQARLASSRRPPVPRRPHHPGAGQAAAGKLCTLYWSLSEPVTSADSRKPRSRCPLNCAVRQRTRLARAGGPGATTFAHGPGRASGANSPAWHSSTASISQIVSYSGRAATPAARGADADRQRSPGPVHSESSSAAREPVLQAHSPPEHPSQLAGDLRPRAASRG